MDDAATATATASVEKETDSHLTSPAAFVEGGIQEACDDACSICLENFCDSDPSMVTSCKHEFHLQCILEWCQRSSQCPMCWQPISFKDPTSQELLEGVERERSVVMNPRNTTIFRHPTLGDFELQHLPAGATDAELEERIFQHLAAAAAMGRAHLARRDGRRGRSGGSHGRPQYLVFSADPNAVPAGPVTASSDQRGTDDDSSSANSAASPFVLTVGGEPGLHVSGRTASPSRHTSPVSSASNNPPAQSPGYSRSSSSSSNQGSHDRAGPSDLQSFSETLKSRFAAVSTKYKESLARSTRGWKERLFSRNNSVSDIGSEVRREMNAGIATVSRMMERFETREDGRSPESLSPPNEPESHTVSELPQLATQAQQHIETEVRVPRAEPDASTSCFAPSGSN